MFRFSARLLLTLSALLLVYDPCKLFAHVEMCHEHILLLGNLVVSHECYRIISGIIVTNDGNAILSELDLAHPAAKVHALSPPPVPAADP